MAEKPAREKPRLMLVASKITDESVTHANKNPRIELFECDLIFKRRSAPNQS
jgi:hypothetical protein